VDTPQHSRRQGHMACCCDGLLAAVRHFYSADGGRQGRWRRKEEASHEDEFLSRPLPLFPKQDHEEFATPLHSRSCSDASFFSTDLPLGAALSDAQHLDVRRDRRSMSQGSGAGCFAGCSAVCLIKPCLSMPSKPRLPRSVPKFFKNLGNRDPLFFPDRMPLQPTLRPVQGAELSDDELILIAYHENGVPGVKIMKLGMFLQTQDARSIMQEALQNQAPRKGETEQVMDENRFNKDVERLLREKKIMPVLRVVPETSRASKEDQRFSPFPGFRSFVEDLRRKVISYDPRAKPSEPSYDPEWLKTVHSRSSAGVLEAMKLVPDDLQRRMIITFELRQRAISPFEEDAVSNLPGSTEVLIHIDRTQLRDTSPENALVTLQVEDPDMKDAFTSFWTSCWLQDYSHHQAVGKNLNFTRGFASRGWMPMQLRGLRDSFAQILTDTRQILFCD
jgi:hypothetical protein